MARDTRRSAANGPALQLIPAATGFDFLEGAFHASQRARQVFLTFALLAVVGVGVLVMLGLAATVGTSMDRTTLSTLEQERNEVFGEIGALGGTASGNLAGHVDKREAAISSAVADEVDVPTVLAALQAATPSGVTLTGITFGSAAPAATALAGEDAAPAAPAGRQLTISAKVENLPQVQALQSALKQVTLISNVDASWNGSVPAITVTVTATIADSALTARAQEFAAPTAGTPAEQTGN